jgi:hypothetical protein
MQLKICFHQNYQVQSSDYNDLYLWIIGQTELKFCLLLWPIPVNDLTDSSKVLSTTLAYTCEWSDRQLLSSDYTLTYTCEWSDRQTALKFCLLHWPVPVNDGTDSCRVLTLLWPIPVNDLTDSSKVLTILWPIYLWMIWQKALKFWLYFDLYTCEWSDRQL